MILNLVLRANGCCLIEMQVSFFGESDLPFRKCVVIIEHGGKELLETVAVRAHGDVQDVKIDIAAAYT